MTGIVVRTKDGRQIVIETDAEAPILHQPAAPALGGQAVGGEQKLIDRLADAGDTIADVCRTLQQQVTSALGELKPDELTLTFGITLAGELGIPLVSKGSAEGTFEVEAKWTFKKA